MNERKARETARGGKVAWILLLAAAAALLMQGCLSSKRAEVEVAVARAGRLEPGTRASWVRGAGTERELEFIADPDGQWAYLARASSSYAVVSGGPDFASGRATGPPDVPALAADERAWRPEKENSGYEWLELSYATPVHARSVRVREVHGCGSVVMVQLVDTSGVYHLKWNGRDRPNLYVTWLVLDFPETPYLVDGIRITLDTTLVSHWKQIDAVQLVGVP